MTFPTMGFAVPGNYSLIWNSPQFHKAHKTFQKNDKNLRCKRWVRDLQCYLLHKIATANMISLYLYLPELGLNKTVDCQSQIEEGFMELYP